MALVLRAYYMWENKKRDREDDGTHLENEEFLDLTDRENRRFRYRL